MLRTLSRAGAVISRCVTSRTAKMLVRLCASCRLLMSACPSRMRSNRLCGRILWTVLMSCLLSTYVIFWLQTVFTFTEVIPFQKDLKLFSRNVFIGGELEAYNVNATNFTVDCPAFKKKHTKSQNFVYVAVLTSNKSVHTLGKAVFETWGQEADRIEFYTGNGSSIDVDELPIVKLNSECNFIRFLLHTCTCMPCSCN